MASYDEAIQSVRTTVSGNLENIQAAGDEVLVMIPGDCQFEV